MTSTSTSTVRATQPSISYTAYRSNVGDNGVPGEILFRDTGIPHSIVGQALRCGWRAVNRTYWAKKKKERDTALCLASQNLIDQESRANFEDALQKLEGIGQHTEAQLNKSRAKIQITKAVSGVADSIWEMHAAEQSLCQQEHAISNQLQSYSSVSSGNHQSGIETGRSEGWVDWTEAGKQLRHLDVLCPGGGRDSVINSLLCDGMPMPDVERRLHTLDSVQETQVWGGLSHQPSSRYSGHTMTRK